MTSSESVFQHDNPFTIGIEEEYMLCNPETGELINRANEIMENIDSDLKSRYSYELILSEIEINTSVCKTVSDAIGEIIFLRGNTKILGESLGFRLGISGTHPTAICKNQLFVDNDSYRWVAEQLSYYARRNITFANHVHVAVNGAECAIHVANALRRWITPLLALSTNSPFFEGEDTGLHSYRTKLFEALPLAGMPDYLNNWNHFENLTEHLEGAGIINSVKDLWWDVRPHPGFGTVEIRVCDIPINFKEIIALVALMQALVVTLIKLDSYQDTHIQILQSNKWQAARYGLNGVFVDPKTFKKLSMRKAIENLYILVEPAIVSLGLKKYSNILEEISNTGTGSDKQRKLYASFKNFEHMLKNLKEQFYY